MSSDPAPQQVRSLSRELADFLAGLAGRVPVELTAQAVDSLVDTLAAVLYGARLPWSQAVIEHALASGGGSGSGRCAVIGTDQRTTAAMAAMANGASAHSFELDDVHEEAISHPGAVVIPAALALAEEVNATTIDVLEAIVIGYEAMGRAGLAVGPASHMLGGFHPTSMSGVFGAAAAAGRLLGFDGRLLNHAFGIAASLASGTMEFAASGGMAKRLHAGRAAEGGLLAARLALRRFEGAKDGLAGRYGFCRVFTDQPRVHLLTDGLGRRWMMQEITIKPYAACSDIHPMIQAASELKQNLLALELTTDHIVTIQLEGPKKVAEQNSLDGTTSVMAAQYSAQWNAAAALVADPADPAIYGVDRIADPTVADLQAKVVSVSAHRDFDATYAWKLGGRVRLTLSDSSVLEHTVHGQKGSMHDPLTTAEIDAKFEALTAGLVPAGVVSAIRTATTIDQSVAEVLALLRRHQ